MMRNWFHFISLAAVMFFGLVTVAAADTFRIRLTGARCADDPACHNRFHPAIKPVITVKPGDTVIMETRDAFDGQITRASTAADVIPTFLGGRLNLNLVHPLTGPVAIQGPSRAIFSWCTSSTSSRTTSPIRSTSRALASSGAKFRGRRFCTGTSWET